MAREDLERRLEELKEQKHIAAEESAISSFGLVALYMEEALIRHTTFDFAGASKAYQNAEGMLNEIDINEFPEIHQSTALLIGEFYNDNAKDFEKRGLTLG